MNDVKILLVEDETIEAMDIKRTVESFGYHVPYIASTGEEAIRKTFEIMPDLVLMDIVLKGEKNGIEAASEIKNLDIPVIYLTAHSEESTVHRAIFTEPYGYIKKPYDVLELKFAIEMALYKHESEIKLKSSERKFRYILENSLDAAYRRNLETDLYDYLSPVIEQVLGYSAEEFISMPIEKVMGLIHPDDREYVNTIFTEAFSRKTRSYNIEYRFRQKDGRYKWMNDYGSIVQDDMTMFLVGSVRDIDEMKKRENAYQESEKNYRDLVDNSMVSVYKTNIEGDILFANESMAELFGYSVEEFKKKNASEFYKNPEDRKIIIEKLQKQGFFSHYEVDMLTKTSKTITILLSAHLKNDIISGMIMDITKRKKSEKKLEISEKNYQAIFENSGTGILTFDKDGTIIMFNSEWRRLGGYSHEELEGKRKWMEFVHPDYLEKMLKYHKQRVEDPESVPHQYETVFITKNGGCLFTYITVTAIPGTDQWLVSATDITDLKNTQKKLEKSVLRFRALAEYTLDGIVTSNINGDILYFNTSALKMFGYSKDELINSQLTKLMPKRYRKKFTEGLEQFRLTGKHKLSGRTTEIIGIRKDGTEFPFEMSLAKWEIDNQTYFTAIIRDITTRKQTEKALKESENKYKNLFESNPDYTILVSTDGTLLEVNEAATDFMGMSREELIGSSYRELNLFPEKEMEFHKKLFTNFLRGERIDPYQYKIINKNGAERWAEARLIPLKVNNKINTILVIASDITEKKKAVDKLKSSLNEKEILIKEIHHRVKNNLQIISSLLNLQTQQLPHDELAVNVLNESHNRVMSMSMIHESLYQSPDLTQINFDDYIKRLITNLFDSYTVTNQITPQIHVEDIKLNIDTAIPCGLIINELISNSLKHAFPDGRKGKIKVSLKKLDDKNELIISDNGIGFPEELDYKNTGSLGLQLVNNLVKQLDGTISMDTNHGTNFRVIFRELKYPERI